MYTINDTMFALILRFIGNNQDISFCNEEFLQKQFKTIQEHISQFPPEEQRYRTFEWIEKYAKEYRKSWEKEILTMKFSDQRCPDCPLVHSSDIEPCKIHTQWLELLQQYVTDTINSSEYVENVLNLLAAHKEQFKIKLSTITMQ